MPDRRLYVVNAGARPVGVGVQGELFIGGGALAQGYLDRPGLTAQRFVPDAFSGRAGERLYRSGDLVRYHPDGDLEYLGRSDHQVKIRGYRIELGEIEAVLAEHPAVSEAVVLAPGADGRAPPREDVRLVAYVTAMAGQRLEAIELRTHLSARLPLYMVPAALLTLAALPRTPNGKTDRAALGRTAALRAPRSEAIRSPAHPGPEEILAEIWQELLGVDSVGRHDDFFALGGHSLLAVRLVARVREVFGAEVPVRGLFESPTVASLARELERALDAGGKPAAPLRPVPRHGHLALSFAQQRLWFLDRLVPSNPFYNIPCALRLGGELRVAALEVALDEIRRRHESLRTTFETVRGQGVQRIHEVAPCDLPMVDLAALGTDRHRQEAQRLTRREALRCFDLAIGPLLRAYLLRLSGREHVLLINQHHVISDGWSLGVLFRELSVLYDTFRQGLPSPLPELAVQYADFAAWQREWLSGDVLEQQLTWWRRLLGDDPPQLRLPTDRPRPSRQTFQGARRGWKLSAQLTGCLKRLSRQAGATLGMTLLAAFYALLHRITGQERILAGTPVANRRLGEVEDLIGFFVNTLVMVGDVLRAGSFRRLLAGVRETALGAYTHQDLPFEKLVEELALPRDLSRNPLFQVMFAWQNVAMEPPRLTGLELDTLAWGFPSTHFDLEVHFREEADTLVGVWVYSRDLFDATTVTRMGSQYLTLLENVATSPEVFLCDLAWFGDSARHQALVEWNDSRRPCPEQAFTPLFVAQARRTPETVAVTCGDALCSYGELRRWSSRLARHLGELGVTRGQVVGLCAERSPELLVAVLAVLETGAAFLPLDPHHPTSRLERILQSSAAPWVLMRGARRAPGGRPSRTLDLDEVLLHPDPGTAPAPPQDPRDLAYVIFTSGSTGVPKGAMVEHRGMVNHLRAKIQGLGLTAADTVAQTAPQTFDVCVWQFLAVLLVGGRLRIFADKTARQGDELLAQAARHRVSILEVVPSMLRMMLEEGARQDVDVLRCLVLTGEALPPELSRLWQERYPAMVQVNAYGPTECSDDVTHHFIGRPLVEHHTLPIGRPVPNSRLYVSDPYLRWVPIAVPGEVCVAGDGVGRGYLNDPRRSAELFVPEPSNQTGASTGRGGRLYRTGDLGRFLADGNLEFLGRKDHQVKVRGLRIELGEIESLLALHPAVTQAVVLVRETASGELEKRGLACCYLPRGGRQAAPSSRELRTYLAAQLPDYMIPRFFVALDEVPLSPAGKVDRKALANLLPEALESARRTGRQAPRSSIERAVAEVFAAVLGVERVGLYDDFFTLGGHSLLAVRLMSRLELRLGRNIPLSYLFQDATVEGLAQALGGVGPQQAESPPLDPPEGGTETLVAIQTGNGVLPPFYCVHPAGGHVLCYRDLARHLGATRPFYGLEALRCPETGPRHEDLKEMAADYLELIRSQQAAGPYFLGGWSMGGAVAFEMARQLRSQDEEVAFLGLLDTSPPVEGSAFSGEACEEAYLDLFVLGLGLPDHGAHLRRELSGLDLGEALKRALAQLRGGGGPDADVDLAHLRERYQLFKSHVRSVALYHPRPYDGEVTFFRPRGSSQEELIDGWSALCRRVEVQVVPGDHFTMVREPFVRELAARLRDQLEIAGKGIEWRS